MDATKEKNTTIDTLTAKVDSVGIIPVEKKDSNVTSLFKNNLLVPTEKYPHLHTSKYDYITSSVLLILFVLFVWLYTFNFKTINQVVKDFFQFRYGTNTSRERTAIASRSYVFMALFFVITISILIGRILDHYGIRLFSLNLPDEIILGILIISMYSIKFLVIKLTGYILKLQKEAKSYFYQVLTYCNALGLFLLPVIILLSFFKQAPPAIFIFTGVTFVLTFLFIRIVNGIVLGVNSSKISKFYLFIYLCALEILPLIIVAKLVILAIH
jgi:hypothetical protein